MGKLYELQLSGLRYATRIGVFEFERKAPQQVVVDIRILAKRKLKVSQDRLDPDLDYNKIHASLSRLMGANHVDTVEILGERITDVCLFNARLLACQVRIGKTEIYDNCNSVGCLIRRLNSSSWLLDKLRGNAWLRSLS